jgi:hypothetical protein
MVFVCTACGQSMSTSAKATASVASCDGSSTLCSKRLNEVVFPGTHNSYAASSEPGGYFASQTYPIARQLADGVRAFLIDIHSGVHDPATGRVRTDLAAEGSDRNKVAKQLPASALRVADRAPASPRAARSISRSRVADVAWLTPRTSAWRQAGELTTIAGRRIFVRERAGTSDGPPVLFLHGYPSSSYDWRHALGRADGRRLIMFDLLGFGLSDKPRDQVYSLLTQADLVEAVVARSGPERVLLVAHDMGSSVATELLARDLEGRLPFELSSVHCSTRAWSSNERA